MLRLLEEKVIAGERLSREEALYIISISGSDIFNLFVSANRIREHFRGNSVDLCAIINAKSGLCSEDCSYCAQSSKSKADIDKFPLIEKDAVVRKAQEAKEGGARRFCIVTSGRKPTSKDLEKIAEMISSVRSIGLLPCATLGLLSKDELFLLKEAGLERFHNNLETSERFFPEICTTHTYQDKLNTIHAVREVRLSLCSGGIFGMGETWDDRIDMAFVFREIDPDSIPINFLNPIKGTMLGEREFLHPFEALKIISLYRFILPDKEIRICGGRVQTLGEFNSYIFFAGADGLLVGNYLTTLGRDYKDDLRLINQHGLKISQAIG